MKNQQWLVLEIKLAKEEKINTIEDFKEKMVKKLTKGHSFKYYFNPEIEKDSNKKAREIVDKIIESNKELIPW